MNWMPEISKANLRYLVAWWVLMLVILLFTQWRSRRATGLPLAYAMNLSLIHLFGAFSYCFDYYSPRSPVLLQTNVGLKSTYIGFWVSVVGFSAFVTGSLLAPLFLPDRSKPHVFQPWPQITWKLPGTMLTLASLFFLFGPLLGRIPSMTAVATSGTSLSVLAIVLFCYQAFHQGQSRKFFQWLSSTAAFPFITLIFMGFASYGISYALSSWQLILRFFRPRWFGLLLLALASYGGISLYINYMRERDLIRESVWGERNFSNRFGRLVNIFTRFELYSPYKQHHLETVDGRLNQNDLVGKSVEYIRSNRISFADGGTLVAAAVSMVPRILWPNKPVTGGSGSLVSRYTGQRFEEGTSIGIGQVMEFYINWGMPCVITGFLCFGFLMRYLDMKGAFYLQRGDYWNCARWLLPGLGMIQPGGVLAEIVGTMAGSFVLVYAMHFQFFAHYYDGRVARATLPGHGSKNSYRP